MLGKTGGRQENHRTGRLPSVMSRWRCLQVSCQGAEQVELDWAVAWRSRARRTRRAAVRAAQDQARRVDDLAGWATGVGDAFDQQVGRGSCHRAEVAPHGGEVDQAEPGQRDVVEADHGDVAGDGEPGGPGRLQRADREHVVGAEDRGRRRRERHQPGEGLAAVAEVERAASPPRRDARDTLSFESGVERLGPRRVGAHGRGTADEGDPAVA